MVKQRMATMICRDAVSFLFPLSVLLETGCSWFRLRVVWSNLKVVAFPIFFLEPYILFCKIIAIQHVKKVNKNYRIYTLVVWIVMNPISYILINSRLYINIIFIINSSIYFHINDVHAHSYILRLLLPTGIHWTAMHVIAWRHRTRVTLPLTPVSIWGEGAGDVTGIPSIPIRTGYNISMTSLYCYKT